jgi:peptide/nickel transport system permease protein
MVGLKTKWQDFRVSMQPRVKEWKFMLRRIRETPLSLVGLAIVLFFVIIAVLAPVLSPGDPTLRDPFLIPRDMEIAKLTVLPTPPTVQHIFGTTTDQYDLFHACIWGTITAFRISLLVIAVSLVIGLMVGTLAAYYGGLLDEALMRLTDIVIAFPSLILAMALVIAFPTVLPVNLSLFVAIAMALLFMVLLATRSDKRLLLISLGLAVGFIASYLYFPLVLQLGLSRLDKVMVSIILVGWPGYTRVIRGEVLRVKNEDFIEAAKASGSSDLRVMARHILPNSIYPIVVMATLDIGSIVLTAAALSFLGLGAPPNFSDWGQVISVSRQWISQPAQLVQYFHTFLIPGLFIAFFVMGWNLLGDALRDVLDPMLRRR